MNNFDTLHVNSLKNDGQFESLTGTQYNSHASYNFGTLSGNHNIIIHPTMLSNSPHFHVYGNCNGFTLTIHLYEGLNPDDWDPALLDGKEFFLTTHTSTNSATNIFTYWNPIVGGPKQLDDADITIHKNHGVFINWFNGEADATHVFSKL